MNADRIIWLMIALCFAVIFIALFSRPLKYAGKFALNFAAGALSFTLLNLLGLSIGANAFTCTVAAFLGLPGIIGLTALSMLL